MSATSFLDQAPMPPNQAHKRLRRGADGARSTLIVASRCLLADRASIAPRHLSRAKVRERKKTPSPNPCGVPQPSPRITERSTPYAAGFTLLEISVVLFLMGLMLLIAMPYMGSLTDSQLKSVSRRLAGRATYLYDEASARKLVIRLVFDMDNNAYFVMTGDPYSPQPAFFPDTSPSGGRVILPDAVRIRDVTVEGIGTLGRGTIATQFYPEGYVDATIVHLIDSKGRIMTLGIDPLTGHVMIGRGDLRKTRPAYQ